MKQYNWLISGLLASFLILLIIIVSLFGILKYSSFRLILEIINDRYIQSIIYFTIYQSLISCFLSILIALPLALTIQKYVKYRLVKIVLSLAWLSFISPVIIGVFAIIKLHGISGWISDVSLFITGEKLEYIYGLNGILIAHIFFNVPFALRMILGSLNTIPYELWRVAIQNNLNRWQLFKILEWPAIRNNILITSAIIFCLCFTSFVVVLILGGGPKYSIIEVAIYYALKIEFNIDRAVALGIIQIVLASFLALLIISFTKNYRIEPYTKLNLKIPNLQKNNYKILTYDIFIILVGIAVFLLPIMALIVSCLKVGNFYSLISNTGLFNSLYWTIILGFSSGILSVLLSMMLLMSLKILILKYKIKWLAVMIELSGNLILILPPILLATGIFLSLRNIFNIQQIAPYLIIGINCLTTIPFTMRILGSDYLRISSIYSRLFDAYNITGISRILKYEIPMMRSSIATSLAISITLSMGDLGVISLFGSTDIRTLPLYIYQSLGSYRMDYAAQGILLLLILTTSIIFIAEQIFGEKND